MNAAETAFPFCFDTLLLANGSGKEFILLLSGHQPVVGCRHFALTEAAKRSDLRRILNCLEVAVEEAVVAAAAAVDYQHLIS